MWDKLDELEKRYDELTARMSDPDVIGDPQELEKAKAHAELAPTVESYREWRRVQSEIEDTEAMLNEELDADMRDMVKEELQSLKERSEELHSELKRLLLPKDPNDEKNIIVEIRAGAGGEEAALFAADIVPHVSRYAEERRWRVEMLSSHETELGGFKEVIFMIHGKGAYSRLKYESGVHRVHASLKRKPRAASIHPPRRWPYCRKRRKLIWKFAPMSCASMYFARAAKAAKA